MDIFDHLNELQVDLKSKNLEEIEEKYFNICSTLADLTELIRLSN